MLVVGVGEVEGRCVNCEGFLLAFVRKCRRGGGVGGEGAARGASSPGLLLCCLSVAAAAPAAPAAPAATATAALIHGWCECELSSR